MYRLLLIAAALCLAAFTPPSEKTVEWLTPTQHDFGAIPRNRPAVIRFDFKNTGPKPIVIDNVRTPCGCTAVEWPDTPIAPGEKASVLVEYNAAQSGYFYKVIKVFFHGIRSAERLTVEGTVE